MASIKSVFPEDFFVPGIDQGLYFVPGQNLKVRYSSPARVSYLAPTSYAGHRLMSHKRLSNWDGWKKSVVMPTILAVVENATFDRLGLKVHDKYLLSGAVGDRLFKNYPAKGPECSGKRPGAALQEWMRTNSFRPAEPPSEYQEDYADLDFIVPAKNFYNFYHFTREALHFLALYRKFRLSGRILIYANGKTELGFVRESVQTWYSDIADRVELRRYEKEPAKFERCLIPYHTNFLYFQSRDKVMKSIGGVGRTASRDPKGNNVRSLHINSIESTLADFQRAARKKIAPRRRDRRLYVIRKSSRVRRAVGERDLIAKLRKIGFEVVAFEDYSNFEQARMVAEAEVVVGIHGAGMANMIFAPRGCHVIELSNLQTIEKRFGDFNGFAIASDLNYHHIILDHDFSDADNPTRVPKISVDGHRGVVLDQFSMDALYSYILGMLEADTLAALLSTGEALNSSKDMPALRDFLEANRARLMHEVEPHIWRANVSNWEGDRDGVLLHLMHALRFAPRRSRLIRRILTVAHERQDFDAFDEALQHLRHCEPDSIVPLFRERGWPLRSEDETNANHSADRSDKDESDQSKS